MTNHKPTDTPPTVNQPYSSSRYIKFYFTLLILSTIGTGLALLGLFSIPETMSNLAIAPVYTILSLAGYVVTLVSAVALVLLWQKNIAGLWLKLGSYAANLLLTVGLLITSGPVLQNVIKETTASIAEQGQAVDESMVTSFITYFFYIGLGLAMVASVVFAILWWFAWKNQQKADSDN